MLQELRDLFLMSSVETCGSSRQPSPITFGVIYFLQLSEMNPQCNPTVSAVSSADHKEHTHGQSVSCYAVYVACDLRTCAVCRLHGAKYAVCRLHGTQSADCMVTVQTKDPSKTCDSFSKFQRNLRFSARINFLTKLPNLKENNLCLFDNGYYSLSCL